MDIVKNKLTHLKTTNSFKLVVDKYKVALASFDELEKSVCKAIDHTVRPPKEKHVRRIMVSTHSRETNMGKLVGSLDRKMQKTKSWVVAIKALQLIHRLIQEGNERFANTINRIGPGKILNLSNFRDRGLQTGTFEQSEFVRQYAVYLEQRLITYQETCIRVLTPKYKLNKIYKVKDLFQMIESFHDLLRDFMLCLVTDAITTNSSTINAVGLLLVDSLSIYKILSDAVIKVIDLYFKMKPSAAKIAYDLYTKHIEISNKLINHYAAIKRCRRINSKRIPTLSPPPDTLLYSMKQYLQDPNSFKPTMKKNQNQEDLSDGDDDTDEETEKKTEPQMKDINFEDLLDEKKPTAPSENIANKNDDDFDKAFNDQVSGEASDDDNKTNEFFLSDDLFNQQTTTTTTDQPKSQPKTITNNNTTQQTTDPFGSVGSVGTSSDPFGTSIGTDPFSTTVTSDPFATNNTNSQNITTKPRKRNKSIQYNKPKKEVVKDKNDPFGFLDDITDKDDVFAVKFEKEEKKQVKNEVKKTENNNSIFEQTNKGNTFDDDPFGVGGETKKESKVLNEFLFE